MIIPAQNGRHIINGVESAPARYLPRLYPATVAPPATSRTVENVRGQAQEGSFRNVSTSQRRQAALSAAKNYSVNLR